MQHSCCGHVCHRYAILHDAFLSDATDCSLLKSKRCMEAAFLATWETSWLKLHAIYEAFVPKVLGHTPSRLGMSRAADLAFSCMLMTDCCSDHFPGFRIRPFGHQCYSLRRAGCLF